jgi:hypothetical protein
VIGSHRLADMINEAGPARHLPGQAAGEFAAAICAGS